MVMNLKQHKQVDLQVDVYSRHGNIGPPGGRDQNLFFILIHQAVVSWNSRKFEHLRPVIVGWPGQVLHLVSGCTVIALVIIDNPVGIEGQILHGQTMLNAGIDRPDQILYKTHLPLIKSAKRVDAAVGPKNHICMQILQALLRGTIQSQIGRASCRERV